MYNNILLFSFLFWWSGMERKQQRCAMNDWMNQIRLGSQWFSGTACEWVSVCVHKRFQLAARRKFVQTHTHKLADKSWVRRVPFAKLHSMVKKTEKSDNFSIIKCWPYQCSMGFELIMIWQSLKENFKFELINFKTLAPEIFSDYAKSDTQNAMHQMLLSIT